MKKIGNKQNSFLNGEWAKHINAWLKKYTAKKRRREWDRLKHKIV